MNRDNLTLPLFASELPPRSPLCSTPAMPAHWPPGKRESFGWWCRNGNQEFCSAMLWKNGLTKAEADALVKLLHGQPEPARLTEFPPCAHYARSIAFTQEHAA
ncbi:hypothetical protein [Paracidovorax wautersii]|uniref:hypothetical protein n=1 Tax=Paracidovorax wautersii TaxID=1177982 RepID=UPI0031DA8109